MSIEYEQILVPLDGSDLAEQVLPYVETLAGRLGSRVTLLLATTHPVMYLETQAGPAGVPVALPVANPQPIIEGERRAARSYLEAVADRLKGHGFAVDYLQPEGRAAEAIVEAAQRLPADLIAMTTHGRGRLLEMVFGSVAEAVLHRAPCPVMLIRVAER